ncbi:MULTISPECIES: DUF1189 family protein [unclassified Exiguobacterium]|uniref:DUF1189 family protein n=1 Tax=unclassified Exiguobacterium TaxID=2644629 RepID=UPI00103ED835|nr:MULTISPECIES: DUF1189 family protein [unclassified Exiguobacterium]TCI48345.1 DUF1189 domain-containing protein [Exiguobacterium sp. SH5S32]TCI55233.1 DUF1189 domain-containing protein [Exiguobacterium sp. SH1S4]TCI75025.1 DUF1189 domain-containing protein [Exiguobacterium sp. SH1S1]
MEQLVASLGFRFDQVKMWRDQSIWKSVFYVLIALLISNTIVYGVKWVNQSTQLVELPAFSVTDAGLQYDEAFVFDVPVLDLTVMVGEEIPTNTKQTLLLADEGWVFKRSGVETELNGYTSLLSFTGSSELSERDVQSVLEDLNWFYPVYIYGSILLDLVVHLILISLLALAGLSFKRFVPIRYKEAWTITAYGITAPLVARTIIDLLPVNVPMLAVLYWATVGIFAFMTIRKIGDD